MTDANGTVLVVDDDPDALALMLKILEDAGYVAQAADNGELALISVAAQPPDLVLLDVTMPGIDGFEVCRRIKATETGWRIPILFVSSREAEDWAAGFSLGAVDFISKPLRRQEILARVRAHVELGRLRAKLDNTVVQSTGKIRGATQQPEGRLAERQRTEQDLRAGEQRFQQMANAAPAMIWTSDSHNRIDFWNEYARSFTGRSMQNLMVEDWGELVHPDDRAGQQKARLDGLKSRDSFQAEYRVRRADGKYCWMLDKATPRFLADGRLAGYVGILFDLTDAMNSQERALHAKNLENLRALSAGITHDFNTMVGAIFGEVDLALSEMPRDSPGRENMERIADVAERAADAVRLLVSYVGDRLETGIPELVDLNAVAKEIVPYLRAPFLEKAWIRTNLATKLPWIQADPLQMRLVVLNLIINAIEALKGEKGVVTVATGLVEIGAAAEGGNPYDLPAGSYVKLAVSDPEAALRAEEPVRTFDPYYGNKSLGRGLGLAAIRGIIRSHHGAIEETSTPSGGSTFQVLLPVAQPIGLESECKENPTS